MNASSSLPTRCDDTVPPQRTGPVRVMIVDDSLTVRTIFKRMVESDPEMVVAAAASSAERALELLRDAGVDVVLLDLEMPGMGGLAGLPEMLDANPELQVLVVSSLTEDGAEATLKALSTGAADTMLKPRPGGFTDDYRDQLLEKIRALGAAPTASDEAACEAASVANDGLAAINPSHDRRAKRPEALAIGASTGGIHALNLMLRRLTPDFQLPILITQHLPASFVPVFARQIEITSGRKTHIAEDGTEIRMGEVAIATGHGHMRLRRMGDRMVAGISSEPARSGCLPSVDPMLTSLAEASAGHALAIILSGMGRDGLEGAEHLVSAGGSVWAQDIETSAVWGMPGAVAKAGLATYVASPEALGDALMERCSLAAIRGSADQSEGAPT